MPPLLLRITPLLLALQTMQGGIGGTITDEDSGAPLAGVAIALTDLDRSVVSDERGRYRFPAVPAGPQHVVIRRIGYASRTLHALVPGEGALEINVSLRRLPVVLQRVEVRPALAIRGVEDEIDRAPATARAISLAAVRNHPLLAEPDAFLALSGGDVVIRPEAPTGMHVTGGGSDQTAYLLDGVPVFSPYHAAGSFSAWNPDALDRLQVSAIPSAEDPDALAGTVAGVTRLPGTALRVQGGLSSTQLRLTMDGPVGGSGAGYLVSARSGFPGTIAPPEESSYLRGGTSDILATVRIPAGRSRFELVAYDAANEYTASAVAEGVEVPDPPPPRQLFTWKSRSLGARWEHALGQGVSARTTLDLVAWQAGADATSRWTTGTGERLDLAARRQDLGLRGNLTRVSAGTTTLGVWVRRSSTAYHLERPTGGQPDIALGGSQPLGAAFVSHEQPLSRSVSAALALSAGGWSGSLHIAPQAQLRWEPRAGLSLTAVQARSFQHAQSVRNPESVAGVIFPADLYLGAGGSGVPVARSDLRLLAVAYRPRAGVRVAARAWSRRSRDLVLVAPATGEPFVTDVWTIGGGHARGLAIEGALSGARYGVVMSYGWQAVRFRYGDSTYVPDFGAAHALEGGVVLFPSPTWSFRVGGTVVAGRRSTSLSSPFEWEACNLLDRGCEFGGTPGYETAQLARTALPSYVRVDLGVRKHWHVAMGGRDVLLEGFGTLTNVLGHANVMTFAVDPTTGNPAMLEMRPRAPLVVGLDWRF